MSDTAHARPPESDEQIEVVARNMGWVPEEEWGTSSASRAGKPKPRRFKSAREFVDSVRENMPVLLERNDYLNNQVTSMKNEIEQTRRQLEETGKVVMHMHDNQAKVRQRAFEQGRETMFNEMREAADAGDRERFDRAKEGLDRLEQEHKEADAAEQPPAREPDPPPAPSDPKPADPPPPSNVDPETQRWVDGAEWFRTDQFLNNAMLEEHGQVMREHPELSVREKLDEAERRVKEKFPWRFGINPAQNAPPAVTTPSRPRRPDPNQKTFADLPREDQDNFRTMQRLFKQQGKEYTEEEFLADYAW